MSTGLYSHTTRGTGTVLTAAIYNSDHQNHVTNANPSMIGAYSDDVSQYQSATNPGDLGSEVLSGNLAGEIERLRYVLARLMGTTHWYQPPTVSLEDMSAFGSFPVLLSAANTLLQLQRTENDDTERIVQEILSGSGAGDKFSIRVIGDESNGVLAIRFYIGEDAVFSISADAHLVETRAGFTSHLDIEEVTPPSNPDADTVRLYAFDSDGTSHLAYLRSDGDVTVLRGPSQAEMEVPSSDDIFVTPATQHFHPGHPKAGGNLNGTGTPAFRSGDYGMGAVTDIDDGNYLLSMDTAFANTNYWANAWGRSGVGSGDAVAVSATIGDTKTASTFEILVVRTANPEIDSPEVGITFWGDYA